MPDYMCMSQIFVLLLLNSGERQVSAAADKPVQRAASQQMCYTQR